MAPPDLSLGTQEFLAIKDRVALAKWLGISDKRLRFLLYGRSGLHYKEFDIKKRGGGVRKIAAPLPYLKALQRKLAEVIPLVSPPRAISMAYAKGRGIVDNAKVHRGKRWVVASDLEGFFPSINFGRVRGIFLAAPFDFPDEVATVLAQLCCYRGALPQGAPTSPSISNIVCRSLDRLLVAFAKSKGIAVTRYADDIVFSFNYKQCPEYIAYFESGSWKISTQLSSIIEESGFSINSAKTRVMHRSQRQLVTGLVVNKKPAMPREWRRRNRVILGLLAKYGRERASEIMAGWARQQSRGADSEAVIRGCTAFAASLDKIFKSRHTAALRRCYPSLSSYITYSPEFVRVEVLTEGKTDKDILEFAFSSLRLLPEFQDLRLVFPRWGDQAMGEGALTKRLDDLVAKGVRTLTIGLFDADSDQVLNKYKLAPGEFSSVSRASEFVYAGVLPKPTEEFSGKFCIEHYFPRDFILRFDESNRRLFFLDEFDPRTNRHRDLPFYRVSEKSTLIVDEKVFSTERNDAVNFALSKGDFSERVINRVPPYQDADVTWFEPIFVMLKRLSTSLG